MTGCRSNPAGATRRNRAPCGWGGLERRIERGLSECRVCRGRSLGRRLELRAGFAGGDDVVDESVDVGDADFFEDEREVHGFSLPERGEKK